MKKNIIIVSLILLVLIIFNIFYNVKNSYRYEYKKDNIDIVEMYKKPQGYFTFELKTKNDLIVFNIKNDYSYKRGLIKSVEEYETDEYKCYKIKGLIDFYPVCKSGKNYFFEYKENSSDKVLLKKRDYNIYNKNSSMFFWDYNGFVTESGKKIKLFKEDVYNPSLITRVDNYLFIPNYDEEFFFTSFYLLDIKTLKLQKKNISHEINFDLVYTKNNKSKLNIYDLNKEAEYTIDVRKSRSDLNKGKKYTKKEINKLNRKNEYFVIKDNELLYKLGLRYVKIKDANDIKIISSDEDRVIYLEKDTLYSFHIYEGYKKLASNKEWNYNSDNLIYVL